MKTNIIIEGLNCTGKSSLIKYLKGTARLKDYPVFYERDMKTLAEGFIDTKMMMYTQIRTLINVASCNPGFIFDRFHITEVVYGKVDRMYFNHNIMNLEDMMIKDGNFKMIWCHDSFDNILKRLKEQGKIEHPHSISRYLFLYEEYQRTMLQSKIPVMKVNYLSVKENICEIVDFLLS